MHKQCYTKLELNDDYFKEWATDVHSFYVIVKPSHKKTLRNTNKFVREIRFHHQLQLNKERKGIRMSRAKTYETRTEEILIPIVEDAGVTIYDVEYVKEGSDWYLRVYIDKPEGVNINDCEVVNRALSAKMDELDFIDDAYILEVSSPGLGRALKKERHFEKSIGQEVEVKTYKAVDKEKQFIGILQSYENGVITIETDKKEMKFEKADVASVRLTFDF